MSCRQAGKQSERCAPSCFTHWLLQCPTQERRQALPVQSLHSRAPIGHAGQAQDSSEDTSLYGILLALSCGDRYSSNAQYPSVSSSGNHDSVHSTDNFLRHTFLASKALQTTTRNRQCYSVRSWLTLSLSGVLSHERSCRRVACAALRRRKEATEECISECDECLYDGCKQNRP